MAVLRKEYELSKFWVEWNTITQREGKKGLSRQTVETSKKLKNISLHIFPHHRVSLPETVPGWEQRAPRAECRDPHSRQQKPGFLERATFSRRPHSHHLTFMLSGCRNCKVRVAFFFFFGWLFSWNYGEGNQERQNGKSKVYCIRANRTSKQSCHVSQKTSPSQAQVHNLEEKSKLQGRLSKEI